MTSRQRTDKSFTRSHLSMPKRVDRSFLVDLARRQIVVTEVRDGSTNSIVLVSRQQAELDVSVGLAAFALLTHQEVA